MMRATPHRSSLVAEQAGAGRAALRHSAIAGSAYRPAGGRRMAIRRATNMLRLCTTCRLLFHARQHAGAEICMDGQQVPATRHDCPQLLLLPRTQPACGACYFEAS